METAQTTAFKCEANATGNTVKIQIQKTEVLTLCEVFIFGTGTVEVKLRLISYDNSPTKHV